MPYPALTKLYLDLKTSSNLSRYESDVIAELDRLFTGSGSPHELGDEDIGTVFVRNYPEKVLGNIDINYMGMTVDGADPQPVRRLSCAYQKCPNKGR